MKRLLLIVMVIVVAAGAGFSQNLTVLDDDFNIFLGSLGEHLLPHLQQTAVNGISTGDASVPAYRSFTIGTSLGAVLDLQGWDEAIDPPPEYELLPLNEIVNPLIEEAGGTVQTIYEGFIPYPLSRLTLGGTIAGWQILGTAAWVPNALAGWGLSLGGEATANFSGLEFSILNLGGQVRKTLVEDAPGFPAITAGLGYTYAGFDFAFPLTDDITSQITNVVPGAEVPDSMSLFVDTTIHTAGLELAISKKLAFFVPFIAVTPYFQQSTFSAGIKNFDLTVGGTSYQEQSGGSEPGATVNLYDFALAARGGFDLVFGGFGLFLHGQYSLTTMAPAVTTGMRLSF